MDLTEAYLEAMNRLVRIVLTVAALAIGWAPVARANIVAGHVTSGMAGVHHRHMDDASHHSAGHRDDANVHADEQHKPSKSGIPHPGHCPACVAVAELPALRLAFAAPAAPAAPAAKYLGFWHRAPEPPPPRS